jgi:transcriptional regulator with XRE-family HTH domain
VGSHWNSRDREHDAIGHRLSATRRARQLSLTQLGGKVGVTAACVCKWESDQTFPRKQALTRLAAVLGTSVEYLTRGQELISDDRPFQHVIEDPAMGLRFLSARTEIARILNVQVEQVHILVDRD